MLVILVNGLPAAGKTTLAGPLAAALGWPLLGKDMVKETLADVLGAGDTSWSRKLGAAAMEVIWTLLASAGPGAVVEANLLPETRPFAVAGLARAGVRPSDVVEVWCEVAPELARARYGARDASRDAIHHRAETELDEQWARWMTTAQPLAVGEVIRVDTSGPVDLAALIDRIPTARRGPVAPPGWPGVEMRAKGADVEA